MKTKSPKQDKNEMDAGKIWSLLRLNEIFKSETDWFSERYKKIKEENLDQETMGAVMSECSHKINEINKFNPPAELALQWMFPMPVLVKARDEFESEHIFSWGPYIPKDTVKDWEKYELGDNKLTLNTDWFSANPLFQSGFADQYQSFRERPYDSFTRAFYSSPKPHETELFEKLNLMKLINEAPNLSREEFNQITDFLELKNNYRVLAVPRCLTSRGDVEDAINLLMKHLKESYPKRPSDPLGTDTQWRDFLDVTKIQEEESVPSKAQAIQMLIRKRFSNDSRFLVDGIFLLNEARKNYEGDIVNNYKAIEDKVIGTYPNLLLIQQGLCQ